jgi:prevent-host-death family protein
VEAIHAGRPSVKITNDREPDVVGLRELRQNASDIVRRVQAGDTVTVTVSGRPAARIIPAGRRSWIRWNDIAGLFTADRAAEDWNADRDRLDATAADPWARQ